MQNQVILSSNNVKDTIVYVDGFNLYYRKLKGTNFRWLNLYNLFQSILPYNNIIKVKYFTANVSAHIDPGAPIRQQLYLDALATVPEIEVIKGSFMSNSKFMPLEKNGSSVPEFRPQATTCSIAPPPVLAKVKKTEEKGSDVNLGVHMVFDACTKACSAVVAVTNDTDLVEPMRLVSSLGYPVGLVATEVRPHHSLSQHANFIRQIRDAHLKKAQFPPMIVTAGGKVIKKPAGW